MITMSVHDHEIEVEQYFVTLFFDREEVESMIMDHYRDEYSDNIFRVVDE